MGTTKSKKRPTWKVLLYNFLGMLFLGIILVIAALLTLSSYTKHGEYIEVPEMRGLSETLALEKIKLQNLRGEVIDTGYNRALPDKTILEQSLAPGTKVKAGRMVYLTINTSKAPTIALPDIANNTSRREAETRLRAMGFKLTAPEVIDGDADWVYEVKSKGRALKSGTRISTDAILTLVVGNGKAEELLYGIDSTGYNVPDEEVEALFE